MGSANSGIDRKSTRLNSSHLVISYAVFCLKKKKNIIPRSGVQIWAIDHFEDFVSCVTHARGPNTGLATISPECVTSAAGTVVFFFLKNTPPPETPPPSPPPPPPI